jgi:hypothetical protein
MTRRSLPLLAAALCLLMLLVAADRPGSPYPATKTDTVVERLHGTEVSDPYRWLEDRAEDVKDWVEKQNAHTEAYLDRLPHRGRIRDRLTALLEIGTITTPVPVKGRVFYGRRDGTQNQTALLVREGLEGQDQVVVDPTELSEEGAVALDWWYPSRDGSLVAYGLSKSGSDACTLHIREVAGGKQLPDVIPHPCLLADVDARRQGLLLPAIPNRVQCPRARRTITVTSTTITSATSSRRMSWSWRRPAGGGLAGGAAVSRRPLARRCRAAGLDEDRGVPQGPQQGRCDLRPLVEKSSAVYNVVPPQRHLRPHERGAPHYRLYAVDPFSRTASGGPRSFRRPRTSSKP